MKKIILIMTILTFTTFALISMEIGKNGNLGKAADFSLEDAEGNVVKLSQFEDKLILLDFWATWCVPCIKELPHLSNIQEKYGDDVVVLAISIDKARKVSKAKALVKSNGYKFTTLLDPKQEVANLYNMVNPPRTMLIDPQLNIVFQHDGYKLGDEKHLEAEIINWLKHKDKQTVKTSPTIASPLSISGINEFSFIYKSSSDSLNSYATEKFKFNLRHKDFRFGISYYGEFPKYYKFEPLDQLQPENLSSEWKDIYGEYNNGTLTVRGGKYDLLIGSGMIMHAYYNTDLDEDYSLNGFYGNYRSEIFNVQTFYGILPNKDFDSAQDVVNGIDTEIKISKQLSFGIAGISNQQYQGAENFAYNIRETYSGRIKYSTKLFELNSEFASSKQYHNEFENEEFGHGFYSDLNIYAGKFTFTTAYKNYDNFYHRLNELPTANNSEKPLVDYGYNIGSNEQGVMGVIRFIPNEKNEFIFNGAYGWSEDFDIEQVDIFAEYNRKFDNFTFTSELKHTESKWLSVTTDEWAKESSPAMIFDFMFAGFSTHTKIEFTVKEHSSYQSSAINSKSYEPLLQLDLGKGIYSISLLSSTKFHDFDEIADNSPKLGIEFIMQAWKHTDLKFFVGSEKGGLVCRNGVCNMQTPFEGARFNITTRF